MLVGFGYKLSVNFQGYVQVPLLQPLRRALMTAERQSQLQNVFDLTTIQRVCRQS